MDRMKRNTEIVALVMSRKMPMRKIAARYGLSTPSISRLAIRHGVHAKAVDPNKVQAAGMLIKLGMPLTHVAETTSERPWRSRRTAAACCSVLSLRAGVERPLASPRAAVCGVGAHHRRPEPVWPLASQKSPLPATTSPSTHRQCEQVP